MCIRNKYGSNQTIPGICKLLNALLHLNVYESLPNDLLLRRLTAKTASFIVAKSHCVYSFMFAIQVR